MIAAMDILCRGAKLCNPTNLVSHQHTGDRCIDDVANIFDHGLAIMLHDGVLSEEIAEGMQQEAQV
jgi:hypothetical protein